VQNGVTFSAASTVDRDETTQRDTTVYSAVGLKSAGSTANTKNAVVVNRIGDIQVGEQ